MHSNIWGLCHTTNVQGFKYFVSFIDDCFRVSQLFLRKERFKVSHVFKLFIKKKKNQLVFRLVFFNLMMPLTIMIVPYPLFVPEMELSINFCAFVRPNRVGC